MTGSCFDRRMKKILLSWSGGKDSAWALHLLRQAGDFEVGGLLTTVNERFRRVAIHGFREASGDDGTPAVEGGPAVSVYERGV